MAVPLRLNNSISTDSPRVMRWKTLIRSIYHLVFFNLFYRRSLHRRVTTQWRTFHLTIEPTVLHPRIFRSGKSFAEFLLTMDLAGKKVLDMGTGSGILALAAAARGAHVTASDNNPAAVQCAAHNVHQNGLDTQINVVEGNLFTSIMDGDYDIILFNPPYLTHLTETTYDSALYGGPDLSVIRNFASSAATHLKSDGFVLLMISSDSDVETVTNVFRKHHYSEELLERKRTLFEDFLVLKFVPVSPLEEDLPLVCPSCQGVLALTEEGWKCEIESIVFKNEDGTPDFVLPRRREAITQFLSVYETIRRSEGWGSNDIEYYHQLPYKDIKGKHSNIWKIRSKTFDVFLQDLIRTHAHNLRILDLGAGNCWLSKRLADKGHKVVAVDICTDSLDGLGVAHRLELDSHSRIKCIRAEYDYLPFPDECFDIIIFNASLHYARDPYATLLNTLRLLSQGGSVYVLDSPIYSNARSGQSMIDERLEDVQRKFGLEIPQDFAGSFLTYDRLDELEDSASVKLLTPTYGLAKSLRRVFSGFRRRESASFEIVRVQKPQNQS